MTKYTVLVGFRLRLFTLADPRMPNQIGPHLEQRMIAFALGHPGNGPRRISAGVGASELGWRYAKSGSPQSATASRAAVSAASPWGSSSFSGEAARMRVTKDAARRRNDQRSRAGFVGAQAGWCRAGDGLVEVEAALLVLPAAAGGQGSFRPGDGTPRG